MALMQSLAVSAKLAITYGPELFSMLQDGVREDKNLTLKELLV